MTDHLTEQVLKLFTLNEKQRDAATQSGRDVVVTAGAGSGKTSTLVARYACLLAQDINPRSIAAITFSIKAAQEMRSRVRSKLMELEEKAVDESDRLYWSKLSSQINSARIGTIHSLCAEIIRNHPAEAGVDPRFDVMDQGLADALKTQVVEDEMARLVEEELFLPLLFNMPVFDLSRLLRQMLQRRLETMETFEIEVNSKTRLIKEFSERMNSSEIKGLIQELRIMSPKELLFEAGDSLAEMVRNLLCCWSSAEEALTNGDIANCAINLYNARRNFLRRNLGRKDGSVKPIIAELQELFDAMLDPLTGGAKSTDKSPSMEAEELFTKILPLLRVAFDRVQQAYRETLDLKQALDFDDLEYHTQRLLAIPEIRQRWQQELEAIMVDEYQDTNPRQRDIVNALSGDRGCLFIVGDMRQSIYRFRRADVTVFRDEQKRIDKQNGLLIDLDLTYRAHEQLLNATGDLLSAVIGTQEIPTKNYYIPYTPLRAYKKTPEHPVMQPHIEFVVGAAEDAATGKLRAGQALAMRLKELKDEGQITSWDEVVLLFRATTGYPYYEEALEDAGIPFVSVAGKGFYDRPEIRDLLNILRAISDPFDDLAFAGLLRSPAFGLSDGALFQLRESKLPYWETLQRDLGFLNEQDQASANRALSILKVLLPLVDRIPVAELLKRVVDELDYRSILATADIKLEHGHSIKAAGRLWRNLDKLLSDTHLRQSINVRDFLDLLETINDAGAREGEASAEAEGSVRLMTIHSAKGLEFPVVVMADAGRAKPSSRANSYLSDELGVTFKLDPTPMLFRLAKFLDEDQDKCEDFRLQYVALTRAQSKLIISSHATYDKDGMVKLPGWAKELDKAVGSPSVDFATNNGFSFETQTSQGYPVRAICLIEPPAVGIKETQVAPTNIVFEPGLKPLYQPIERVGQLEVLEEQDRFQEIQSWRATKEDRRVSGKVLGSIVHKALQRWLFLGDPTLDALLEAEAWRAGLATETTRQDVINRANDLLARFRKHLLWNEVDVALEKYSELPYSYLVNDKMENRVIDLLYRDAGGWHIVDFKTDPIQSLAQKEHLIQVYAPQVRRYKAIVESKLGTSVSGQLCFLDDQGEVRLVEI